MEVGAAQVAYALCAGFAVGILSALLGIGGGIVMVPFLVLVLGLGQQEAEGTSLLVIVPTAVAGALAHRRYGHVSMRHVGLLAAGGPIGAWLGAQAALNLSGPDLRRLFGALVIVMGARMLSGGLRGLRSARHRS